MTPQRSKSWGYEVEVAALNALRAVFPKMARTGSVAYKKAAADLVQAGIHGDRHPYRFIVTRDKRRPMLVTLSMVDFLLLIDTNHTDESVVVQVKGRERTWIGSLYDALKVATS